MTTTETSGPMVALVVIIEIKPEFREQFMESMLDDARHSIQDEPGCLRFDVLEDREHRNRILLYEVYRNDAALEFHGKTPHFLRWRETVKDWFASKTVVYRATPVFADTG